MANPNPRTDNLALGRGKKPKLGHQSYKINLSPDDKERLDQIAEFYGCLYAGKGSISGLLAKIADDILSVVPSAPYTSSRTYQLSGEKKLQDGLDQGLQKLQELQKSQKRLDQELQHRLDQELQKRLDQELSQQLDRGLQKQIDY